MSAEARKKALAALTGPGGAYELVERKVPGGNVCRVVKSAPGNLVDILLSAEEFGELEYLSYCDETYTFADVIDQTARLAAALTRLGVRPGTEWQSACGTTRNGPRRSSRRSPWERSPCL